jgi:UDP-N-acetylmuramoyl-tripeptide--D-alanyl-D-alanine ligase
MISINDLEKIDHVLKYNFEKLKTRSFSGVGIDSRTIKKNEIFFSIAGENTDGHNYLDQVFKKNIPLAIVNEKWFRKNESKFTKKIFLVVKDTIKSLGDLANVHRRKFDIPVLCIGGANGKTTTKDLTADVLSQKYKILKSEGNFNNHIGLPLTIFRLNRSHEFCVLEVGCNHFGEINYLCNIAEPDFGLVTNIGREHLEFFKTLKGVARAEFELYDYLKDKKRKILFMNYDDEYIRNYGKKIRNKFTYSYKQRSDVKGEFKKYTKNFEPVIKINFKNKFITTKVSTFGKHSIYNGLAAAAVGEYFDVSGIKIKKALSNFKLRSSKRMEVLNAKGLVVINDTYNSNPESVKMGLESLKEFKSKGEKFVILSDMLELGKSSVKEHKQIGKLVNELGFKNLYTTGKESYNIFLSAKGVKNNFYFENKNDLAEMLKINLNKGDTVYIKGSRGMKMEEVVKSISKK